MQDDRARLCEQRPHGRPHAELHYRCSVPAALPAVSVCQGAARARPLRESVGIATLTSGLSIAVQRGRCRPALEASEQRHGRYLTSLSGHISEVGYDRIEVSITTASCSNPGIRILRP